VLEAGAYGEGVTPAGAYWLAGAPYGPCELEAIAGVGPAGVYWLGAGFLA